MRAAGSICRLSASAVSENTRSSLIRDNIQADVAVLGAPFDGGTQWRPGARFGPRAIREASTLFSFGHAGAYDHEDDATYLTDLPNHRHR